MNERMPHPPPGLGSPQCAGAILRRSQYRSTCTRSGLGWPRGATSNSGGAWKSWPRPANSAIFWNANSPVRRPSGIRGSIGASFLTLSAAALALAGMSGCKLNQPEEKIVPYVRQPEAIVPGESLSFATAMPHLGYGEGLLVTSRMGRPLKIEGNPEHPASLGGASALAQASILDLYDPDRSQTVLERGNISTWNAFVAALQRQLPRLDSDRGAGLAVLTETVTSPTLGAQLKSLLARWPQAQWHQYQPLHRSNVRSGAHLAFGEQLTPLYRFDRADVIVSFDCDSLTQLPGATRYARDFSRRRQPLTRPDNRDASDSPSTAAPSQPMCRLYAIESSPTLVGAAADHRWPLRAQQIEPLLRELAQRLGVGGLREADDERAAPPRRRSP